MKIVLLDGALVNQMIQYIGARCLEEALKDTNELILMDDLWFYCPHGEFGDSMQDIEKYHLQLNKFPNLKKIPLMSEYFDADVWQAIVDEARQYPPVTGGSYLPQILKNHGLDFFVISDALNYNFDGYVALLPHYGYHPRIFYSQGSCYFNCYFDNGNWFMSHEEMFRRELALPPLWEKRDLEMLSLIHSSLSISVHIRLGSYKRRGMATPTSYFCEALDAVCEIIRRAQGKLRAANVKPRIFVFSDEIRYVQEHAADYGLAHAPYEVIWGAEERGPEDNQCDMQLMSECNIMILEYMSVYSYMAALLNKNPDKIVINPHGERGVF